MDFCNLRCIFRVFVAKILFRFHISPKTFCTYANRDEGGVIHGGNPLKAGPTPPGLDAQGLTSTAWSHLGHFLSCPAMSVSCLIFVSFLFTFFVTFHSFCKLLGKMVTLSKHWQAWWKLHIRWSKGHQNLSKLTIRF